MVRPNPNLLAAMILCLAGSAAAAEKVSMWVDEDGVTHFSNRQFAPEHAEDVTIEATNGMEAPDTTPASPPSTSSGGASWSKIDLPDKQNPKGRRPLHESLYTGRKHHANQRH